MADQRSVFQPVSPQDLAGPFQGFLTPPQPTPVERQAQQMPGPANLGGGLAMVATAFLQGATQGRIKKYEQEQNDKLQKLQTLNSYMIQIANDPDLTPEAKQAASQRYYQAIGGDLTEATKDVGKNKDGDASHPGHHFGAIMKDLASGLTGGKKPKGAPDPSGAIAAIHAQIYGPDGKPKPEYSAQARQADFAKEAEAIYSKYLPGTPPETVSADPALSALKAKWQRQDPQGAKTYFDSREGAYPQAPSVAAEQREISQIGQKPAATPGPPQQAPSGQPGPPTAPATGGLSGGAPGQALTGLQLTGEQYRVLAKSKRVSDGDDWDVNSKRVTGHIVQLDSGPAFFDMNNRQVDIDLNNLQPWKGVQRVNIVSPANPYSGVSVIKNLNTGVLYDPDTGIPLPPAQQKWQETQALVRPYQDRQIGVDPQKHPIFKRADGTLYTDTNVQVEKGASTSQWLEHYRLQEAGREAHDTREMAKTITSQRNNNRVRINLAADAKLARIDSDILNKDKAKSKAEVEAQRKREIDAEESMYQQSMTDLGEEGSPLPGYGGKKKPGGPVGTKAQPAAKGLTQKAKDLF